MSTEPPPTYWFPNINFNPSFYEQTTGGGLSQAQANALYLRKTVPDTATALETFNQGILVGNTSDFNGNVNVYGSHLALKNSTSPTSIITLDSTQVGTPYLNITSLTNEAELLSGSLVFTQNGSVQVGNTKTLSLGTVGANVALGTAGQTTTINGTVGITGVITNYARTNAANTFTSSQTFSGGVYNIYASTIAGVIGQTTQSLFTNTASSSIALGSSSTVNLDGTLQVTSGTTRVKFNINGVNQDDNYGSATGDTSNLTPSLLTFNDKGLGLNTDLTNVNLTMDSNVLGSTGYKTEILNDKTQANITFLNKSNGTSVAVKHTGIVATVGVNSTTIGVGSISTTDALSIQAGNTGIINFGTTGSRTAAMNIGTGMTSGNITMGAGTSVTVVNGSGIKFDTLSTNNPTASQLLYSNKTGGDLGLGSLMASGNINCFHNTTSTSILNVRGQGGIVTSGTIKMQNDLDTSLLFTRNGTFNIGIDAGATPKLVLGVATGGNEVKINSLGTGTVYSNAGVLTNTSPSDETLKKNIVPLDVSIDNLNPVQYEWINEKMGTGVKYGFLANEVVEIFPDICSTWKTDEEEVKLGMDTVSLIPIMVSAMKKMKLDYEIKLSKLEERLLALENK